MLLDSAQERPFGATVTWVAWARKRRELGGQLVARVDDGVDFVVGIAERDVVDGHARPAVGNAVQAFEAGAHRAGGADGPIELGHLPRRRPGSRRLPMRRRLRW